MDCLAPVSGVDGPGRHIGKEKKKKPLRQKNKTRRFWWRVGWLLFHYGLLILARVSLPCVAMETKDSSSCLLLPSLNHCL